MPWFWLMLAIVLEVSGTTSMKLSQGLTRPLPSVLVFVFYAASLVSLVLALKKIPMSIAYATWAGLGTATVALIGVLYFKEGAGPLRLACIALIILGVVGLRLTSDTK